VEAERTTPAGTDTEAAGGAAARTAGAGPDGHPAVRAARAQADALAASAGLGERLGLFDVASRRTGAGLVGVLAALPLLAVGIGLLAGGFGAGLAAVGAVLTAAGVAAPVLGLRAEGRAADRMLRLHLFRGGPVLTGPAGVFGCAWDEVRLSRTTESGRYGSGGTPYSSQWLVLETTEGVRLCRLNAAGPAAAAVEQAAGGPAREA
jgi:hypothetical protein